MICKTLLSSYQEFSFSSLIISTIRYMFICNYTYLHFAIYNLLYFIKGVVLYMSSSLKVYILAIVSFWWGLLSIFYLAF